MLRASLKSRPGQFSKLLRLLNSVVIEPKYTAWYFLHGMARIRVDGKYGYMDQTGRVVVSPQFVMADDFVYELAPVQVGNKTGFIDKTGSMIIEPQFDKVFALKMLSEDTRKRIKNDWLVIVEAGDKWGVVDCREKKVLIPPQYDAMSQFYEELAMVKVANKYGYIDATGQIVIEPQFDSAGIFTEGLTPVEVGGKWGYIDRAGKYVIPLGMIDKAVDDWKAEKQKIGVQLAAARIKADEERAKKEVAQQAEQEKIDAARLAKERKEVAIFQKTISEGTETNCGPVIEVKSKLVKVSFPIENYGNEHWIRRDQIFPSHYGCHFLNGQYQPPEIQ